MRTIVQETIVDLLARGAMVRFQAHGDSMEPAIRSGDHLIVEPITFSALQRGDIVLSLTGRGLTAHRLIEIGPSTLVTRGDNAPAPDAPFAAAELLGRVRGLERNGRSAVPHGRQTAAVLRFFRRLRRKPISLMLIDFLRRADRFKTPSIAERT